MGVEVWRYSSEGGREEDVEEDKVGGGSVPYLREERNMKFMVGGGREEGEKDRVLRCAISCTNIASRSLVGGLLKMRVMGWVDLETGRRS
jgi:hypothetical protein